MALIDTPEAAMRTARVIVSDILLYNREKIVAGIRDDNLFELLEAEIEEGRKHYRSRVAPGIADSTNFFDRAIVDVLIKPMANVESKMW